MCVEEEFTGLDINIHTAIICVLDYLPCDVDAGDICHRIML